MKMIFTILFALGMSIQSFGTVDRYLLPVSATYTFSSGTVKNIDLTTSYYQLLNFNERSFHDMTSIQSVEMSFINGNKLMFEYVEGQLVSMLLSDSLSTVRIESEYLKDIKGIHFTSVVIAFGYNKQSALDSDFCAITFNIGRNGFFDEFERIDLIVKKQEFDSKVMRKVDHKKFWYTIDPD